MLPSLCIFGGVIVGSSAIMLGALAGSVVLAFAVGWWRSQPVTREAIYAYRTRKPWARWGLPIIGRHWAYVGRTNDLARRDDEHLVGGGRYGAVPKDWADLEPRRYVLVGYRRRREPRTHLLEWAAVRLLWPVYNVSMNRWNPRRIKPYDARRQRQARNISAGRGVIVGARRRAPVYLGLASVLVAVVAGLR